MPRQCLLSHGIQLSVDYATDEDQSACRNIISDSAAAGKDNVGIDEFSDGMANRLDLLLTLSQVFAVRDTKTNTSKAFIIVASSLYARTIDTCLASLFVFRDKDLQSDGDIFDQLLQLAIYFAQALDLGYTSAIYSVAACAHDVVQRLRRQGFIRVATIPCGVRIAGVGLCDNFFMVKSLSPTTRPRRSVDELHRDLDKVYPHDQCYETYQASVLPTADFLPAKYIFANGLAVVCRNMKKQEDGLIYEIWKSAAAEGLGYGIDEIPTLSIFRMEILLDHYCIVFEEIATGNIVGLTLITSSCYSRTKENRFGESSLFIKKEFRGQKLGSEAIWIELALMKQLGFKVSLNDTLASNHRMMASMQSSRVKYPSAWLFVGVIPDGCYAEGYGWDDQVISWFDFQSHPHIKNFTELADETLNRTISKL